MKRRKSFLFPLLSLSALLGGVAVGCSNNNPSTVVKTMEKIELSGEAKTTYHYGDSFERPTVMAVYNDGSKEDITLYIKVNGFNSYRIGSQTVTLSYDTFELSYDVEVVNDIEEIVIVGQKTVFELNEPFSLGGGQLFAVYEDESRTQITSDYTVEGYDSSEVKDDGIITISFAGKSVTYNYQVVSSQVDVITSLEFSNVKTEYVEGEDFVRPTAIANGSIDVSDLVTYEYDLSVGTHVVTGTYKGFSATFTITVTANDSSNIPADTISGSFKLSGDDGQTVSKEGNVYTISEIGKYTASGKLEDGQIIIDVPESSVSEGAEDVVELNLSDVSISCTFGCPIHIKEARDVELSAKKNKNNYLYDRSSLKDSSNDPYGAAIYSEDGDIKLKGTGNLVCISSNNNGIHGKDDVKIQKLNLLVKAVNNGIKGNDSISIKENATLNIVCGSDGLKTSNNNLSSKGNQKGNVEIISGSILINSYDDGIDAAYDAIIADTVDEDGVVTSSPNIEIHTNIFSTYDASEFTSGLYTRGSSKASDSAKGIKAPHLVDISGGNIYCETYDDGIHGNATSDNVAIIIESTGEKAPGDVTISGGSLTVNVSDDGVHADGTLTVKSKANVVVEKSYEGLEGHIINFDGGTAYVTANNDGVNATSTTNNAKDGQINVSGGLLDVTVPGNNDRDGIDSNGSFTQTGGIVVVRGPANGGAWSLDTDGDVNLNGGTIVVVGGIEASSSGGGGNWWISNRPGPGGPGGGGHGGGGMGGGTLNVGSNMTKSTSSVGKAIGTFAVTIDGNAVVTYTNTSSYSSGSVIIYSELGSATVTKV